jgi:hypothetical protein
MKTQIMKYTIIVLIIFINTFQYGHAQTGDAYYIEPEKETTQFDFDEINTSISDSTHKFSMHPELRLGTSIGSFGTTPYMSSFISPALRIQPPGKFSIIVGSSFSFSNSMYQNFASEDKNGYYQKMASYQMYAMGSYRVNENLNVRGGMSVNYFPNQNISINQTTAKQGHFGFDYRLSKNSWVSADFNFGEHNPFQYSPYGTSPIFQHSSMPGILPYRGF